MHALTIRHRDVAPLLAGIHRRRLAGLLGAVVATVSGPRLTLTDIGRRLGRGTDLRHRLQRADRLLGNRHLQHDRRAIDRALAQMLLSGVAEPLILIDWRDLKADQSLHLRRALLPVGGRRLTLYEEVHPQRSLGGRQVQHRVLQRLTELMPATAAPIIVADSGFRVPFYREVERLGWRWVGRVRGRDHVKLSSRWIRDLKSQYFGSGLECSASKGTGRFTVLVLIASLAALLWWLIGTAAERSGCHTRMRPGSQKRRPDSRVFLARLLLTQEDGMTAAAALADAIGPLDQWVANDHDALLAA